MKASQRFSDRQEETYLSVRSTILYTFLAHNVHGTEDDVNQPEALETFDFELLAHSVYMATHRLSACTPTHNGYAPCIICN